MARSLGVKPEELVPTRGVKTAENPSVEDLDFVRHLITRQIQQQQRPAAEGGV